MSFDPAVMLGLGSVAAVAIAKAITDANADDCGPARRDLRRGWRRVRL